MLNFEQPPLPEDGREKEQTSEEIRNLLEGAMESAAHVNLITKKEGLVPDLIVEEVYPDYAYFTYERGGETCEGIPLNFDQIVRAGLRE